MSILHQNPREQIQYQHLFIILSGFDRTVVRQELGKHVQTRNNRGMSSLLSSDSVNILVAANADNNSEPVTGQLSDKHSFQQYIWRGVFYAVRVEPT
jgi:hypothetical protein